MNILLADDDRISSELMRRMLVASGHSVIATADGEAAWKVLTDPGQRIEVGIFDVMMPNLDGIELLERVRHTPGLRNLPVVLCSAANDRRTVERASSLSISQYIVKPYTKSVVLEKLQLIAADLASESPCEDVNSVAARLGATPEDVAELRGGLANDARAWLNSAFGTYQRADLRRLGVAANGLKGGCLNLGLRNLGRELEAVEVLFTEKYEERYKMDLPPSPAEIKAAVNGVAREVAQIESLKRKAA